MPLFNCKKCDYTAQTLQNIKKHINRKTPCDKYKNILRAEHNKISITRKSIKPHQPKKQTDADMLHTLFLGMNIETIAEVISMYSKLSLNSNERLELITCIEENIYLLDTESEESDNDD